MPDPRVTRLSVGRLCNLGNYEHIRYEVTVDIPEGADVKKTLVHIEWALNTLAKRCPVEGWRLVAAKNALVRPEEDLTDTDREHMDDHKKIMGRYNEWAQEQDRARAMLNDFGLSSEYTDHKETWDVDE